MVHEKSRLTPSVVVSNRGLDGREYEISGGILLIVLGTSIRMFNSIDNV